MSFASKSIMVVAFTVGTMASLNAQADPGFHGGRGRGHGDFRHRHMTPLQRLAFRLTNQTHELIDEIDLHCNHTLRYEHIARDAKELDQFSHHIQTLVSRRSSGRHVARDLTQMSQLVEHMDDIIHDLMRRGSRTEIHFGPGGVHVGLRRHDREGLRHIHEELDNIRTVLRQMDREMARYYPGVDRVLDLHHPANRSAVEVRPVVVPPRSTGLNLNFRVR